VNKDSETNSDHNSLYISSLVMTFTGTCLLTTRMQLCVCTSGTVQDGVQTFQASASSRDLPATTAAVSRSATPTMVDDGIPA